jgi:Fe-S-cluster containining protein
MYFDTPLITKSTPEKVAIKFGGECKCDQCARLCMYGSCTLKPGEEKKIAKFLKIPVKKLVKEQLEEVERFNTKLLRPKILRKDGKPYGHCIFFDKKKGLCKIHEVKPIQCKTSSAHEYGEQLHAWFILNYFVNPDDPESIRQYASYLKTNKTIPGGSLLELVPDKIKLRKILNHEILK